MTQSEFYALVKAAGPFQLTGDGIRTVKGDMCPVCAVAFSLSGQEFGNGSWDKAAELIGLEDDIAGTIVGAADDPKCWPVIGPDLLEGLRDRRANF